MADDPKGLTANQLVAYNLMRIRKTLGLSQEEAAERLQLYLGAHWSKSVYSTTERSYHGKRIRQFTADDLLAFSAAFGVPVLYFFLPPKPEDRNAGEVRAGDQLLAWRDLFDVMIGGGSRSAVQPRIDELPEEDQPGLRMKEQLRLISAGFSGPADEFDAMLRETYRRQRAERGEDGEQP